jgi:aryl-alcohol dehydrogenase-like predicted oxidoreductase
MKVRRLGRTGYEVSEVGFGGWAIGGSWGSVGEEDAMAALHAAADAGVTFIDTADVYGDGLSEQRIARFRQERTDVELTIATKAGRRFDPHVAEAYRIADLERFVDRSLANLEVESLDLVQLHCPPTQVYYEPELFSGLDGLVEKGKIRHYGVSVEKVEEAIKAIEFPNVAAVQIIFNVFRQRPADRFLDLAREADVGVICRVPLASGLLSGKMEAGSSFDPDDHRNFNRHGEQFDVGETFAGVPFEVGLEAVDALRPLVPGGVSMAQWAIRWILMFAGVSTVIPGARNAHQARSNAEASAVGPLSDSDMEAVQEVYDRLIRPHVHPRW